jgi:hypothetical protein
MNRNPNPPPPAWDWSHDPEKRPLGCNGRYGNTGAARHYRKGTKACKKCLRSTAHYQRERRRGQLLGGRKLQPCGTNAAAMRHKRAGEELCYPCKLARAEYHAAHPSNKNAKKSISKTT